MSNSDLTARYEEERLRAQEQSQLVYLQSQIDELQRQLKDQTNKYQWAMEQVRKNEGAIAQVQSLFDRHTNEVTQANELVRRDVVALRREVAAALVKIEEGVRPLRDMQSQIQQIAEARKQDRDFLAGWLNRIEQLERQIGGLTSQIKELDERQRQLTLQLERLREADAAVLQEVRRINDELQVEKQSLRRMAVESQQLIADLQPSLDEQKSRIDRLEEIRQQIDLFAEVLPTQIKEVGAKLPDIIAEIKRIERISTERFLMNQERLEELRQMADERMSALQETDEQYVRQLTAWLERIDSWLREIEQRLARSTDRIELEQKAQLLRIMELERREVDTLNAQFIALRQRLEQVRAAHIELGGGDR
ncbi:hypothetical protein [Chloroflexus aggregans]|uniref:Uncharacterized protein n=1 Tax=Chloroflexus aggregans (strain MD-66 / DSM 9485) TaxID=326427 RepID=B8G9S1_CHLAD|nr:hypothetical protein [Chloroflexus aggregans]ACL26424.1 conserved hypothetical protein [Chloroflexus aggregans DSM 9485]